MIKHTNDKKKASDIGIGQIKSKVKFSVSVEMTHSSATPLKSSS